MAHVRPGEEALTVSDTTTCPSCSTSVPAGAAFCTTCGTRIAPAEASATDATRVETAGLHDATQVYAPPPAPASPWQPADAPAAPPPAPAAWGAPPPPAAPAAPPPDEPPG